MQLVFSDAQFWEDFLPLTFTRPVAEMRCGILTFSERWQKLLDSTEVSYLTEDYLQEKFKKIKENEVKVELMNTENADLILVAYGTTARICKNTMKLAKEKGINLGLIRPITLWPYPTDAFNQTIDQTKFGYLTVEMSMGQMVEDVRLSVEGRKPVYFYGRSGGMIPSPQEILDKVMEIVGGEK